MATLCAIALAPTSCATTGGGAKVVTEPQVPPALLTGFQKHRPGTKAHKLKIENVYYIPWY